MNAGVTVALLMVEVVVAQMQVSGTGQCQGCPGCHEQQVDCPGLYLLGVHCLKEVLIQVLARLSVGLVYWSGDEGLRMSCFMVILVIVGCSSPDE